MPFKVKTATMDVKLMALIDKTMALNDKTASMFGTCILTIHQSALNQMGCWVFGLEGSKALESVLTETAVFV